MPVAEAHAAVDQLITLLTEQKRAIELHTQQIHDLALGHPSATEFYDVKQLHALMDRVSKAELFARKLNDRIDALEKDESIFDDELKAGAALYASANVRMTHQTEDIKKLQADLVLFWRMTFLERLAWLLGGARLFGRMANFITWWRDRWQR